MAIEPSPAIAALIRALEALPGYGPRSAQRAAFFLLAPESQKKLQALREALDGAMHVRRCRLCRTWCENELCAVCSDATRDRSLICVVESVQDQMALDASLSWPGLYFVLSGRLSPLDNAGPGEIGLPELAERIELGLREDGLREVVVATSYTPEGDATAYYLMSMVKKRWPDLRITRLSRGLPSGLEIEYTDLASIAGAVEDRRGL
ncbi:recombination mediator RecR [Sutterella sp.]|uniref:recombination mediator RecR n=1 Tax=Sutterella sp. TaxID=1981025 RepID=UPI0026E082C5|nr:recombination mediator RecR [Sutterella sp.]MDO5531526.1 recombination mediator RecR [Sutterella sp.]